MEVFNYGILIPGKLVRRVNRFVCEVEFESEVGRLIECYMANPGSMLGMCVKDARVRVSSCTGINRKFKYSIEAININGTWIGCNTHVANKIVTRLFRDSKIWNDILPFQFDSFQSEVKLGNSRIDFVLGRTSGEAKIFVEVKTVTMSSDWYHVETGNLRADKPFHRFPNTCPPECQKCDCEDSKIALFPDCESIRALKHVTDMVSHSTPPASFAALVYVVMRDDIEAVSPSVYCDANYSKAVQAAMNSGVLFVALKCKLLVDCAENPRIELVCQVPVLKSEFTVEDILTSTRTKRKRI